MIVDVAPARPQVVLTSMRSGSTQLLSRMAGARNFHQGAHSEASSQELLHPRLLTALVTDLGLGVETLRERGPMAVLERIWSAHGPCPVKIMPAHFIRACWRFRCTDEPGRIFGRWLREVQADLVLLRRRNLMAQVASAVRAEIAHNFDIGARSADAPLPWTAGMPAFIDRAAERVGFDDVLLSNLQGIRVYYESLCECGFEHAALPGTEIDPLPQTRDIADISRTFDAPDQARFMARARAGLARGHLRVVREVLPYVPRAKQSA